MPKKIKKNTYKQLEKDLHKKLMLFDELPDECLVCEESFDRTDFEDVKSWNVVVRKNKEDEGQTVNLYCPDCWSRAKETVKKAKKMVEDYERGHSEGDL